MFAAFALYARVAPRAGAWIETHHQQNKYYHLKVAPRAGAWIETAIKRIVQFAPRRRPPRGGVD